RFHPWLGRVAAGGFVTRFVLVEAPLRHVAVHVVKLPRIWLLGSNLVILEVAVLLVPGVLIQLIGIVAKRIGRGGAGATGVFPLGFGGQAMELARFRAEPLAILVRRVLGHADGGVTVLAHAEAHFDIGLGGTCHSVGNLVHVRLGRRDRPVFLLLF